MQDQSNQVEQLHNTFTAVLSSQEDFAVDFDEAWQWIGYSKKQDALIMLEKNFDEGVDFLRPGVKNTGEKGRPSIHIMLTVDCFKAFCMLAQTERGKEVRRYYIQLEKEFRLSGSTGLRQIDPAVERRELLSQIEQDSNEIKRLETLLLDIDLYVRCQQLKVQLDANKARLRKLNTSTVNELNQLANRQGELFPSTTLN